MKRRLLRAFVYLPLIAVAICVMGLASCQSRFIYFPKPYRPNLEELIPQQVQQIPYETDEGRQVAFWLPPRAATPPRQIWLCHAGNASVSLDWLDLAVHYPANDVGFLMVDYPGYGRCEGSCTPGRILASSEAAVTALAKHLAITSSECDQRMCVLGHSLGAACVLQYAARHPTQRVVLVAPFTTMAEMANRTLFWPMSWFLWHRFDNQERLNEVALHTPPPAVVIIHGIQDEVIPVAMGRRLAAEHPAMITLVEIADATHNGILEGSRASIYRWMSGSVER